MGHDVSKITILVLLVLTILVSVLGTLTVMNTISSPVPSERGVPEAPNAAGGFVSIDIVKPVETTNQASGQVVLEIVK